MAVKQETYDKWIAKYGPNARIGLDIIGKCNLYPKELGRIFLPTITEAIKKNNCYIIDDRNWVFFNYNKKLNKMKLQYILSMDHKGTILLKHLESICAERHIPIIYLTVVAGMPAVDWYYKKGFIKVKERHSRKGTLLFDVEKKFFKIGLEKWYKNEI